MATRKKKKTTKRQRSQAAKKGWETRRAKAVINRIDKTHPQLKGSEDRFKHEMAKIRAEVELEFEKREVAVKKEAIQEAGKILSKRMIKEYVKKGQVQNTPEEIILARLKNAEELGIYYEVVQELAEEFDQYSIYEIYTMGVSPK